jgi:transaldolase
VTGSPLGIKLFVDGADVASVLEAARDPRIAGFTTNPTLMRKAGVTSFEGFARELLAAIPDRPISFEVFSDDFGEMGRQARRIASWAENVYVKVPITDTTGAPSTALVAELAHDGIKVNVTAILTLEQVLAACGAVRGGAPAVVSVFAGRIADTGREPGPLMRAAAAICRATGPEVELLWASPREVLNVRQAAECGCHIITATPDLIKKLDLYDRDLAQMSLDTVQMFRRDAVAAGYQL